MGKFWLIELEYGCPPRIGILRAILPLFFERG